MSDDRRDTRPKWKLVTEYGITEYECGLVAGDHVRLKKDLEIKDWNGRLTGETHPAGEIWLVLPGAAQDPGVVWLRQPDGKRHTWTDSSDVWEWFEIASRAVRHAEKKGEKGIGNDRPQIE